MTVKKQAAPARKTVAKKQPKTAAAKPAAAKSKPSMISWLLAPDTSQGWGKWIARAALYAIGMFVFSMAAVVVVTQAGMIAQTGSAPEFLEIAKQISAAAIKAPVRLAVLFAILAAFGMFAFMPRRRLDKTSFVAVIWTSFAWISIGVGLLGLARGRSALLAAMAAVAVIVAMIGLCAGIVCYARKNGVSGLAAFLSFPFGTDLYCLAGYFLPDTGDDRTIGIRYKWYDRFVGFMLNEKNGQIILAVLAALFLAASGFPWQSVFMATFFAVLYFWRGKHWMIKNIKMLSWVAVAANIAAICVMARALSRAVMIEMMG